MEDQLDLKHADSNNSIPPPPPPMPPVATVESLSLHSPDGDESMKTGVEEPSLPVDEGPQPPATEEDVTPTLGQDPPGQEFDGAPEEKAVAVMVVEEKEVRGDNCCDRFLRCLSFVPCGSLVSWILLVLALGGLTGSLLIGTQKTRALIEDDSFLWMMELSVTGVVVSMFVLGTCFLVAGHLSTDPTSRRLFNSSSKNRCARGFNIFLLVLVYILCVIWVLASTVLSTPVVLLVMLYLVHGDGCPNMIDYGFPSVSQKAVCGENLDRFKENTQDILICYGVALFSAVLVVVSMVHFLICISANITHLKDNRFATLNAYETEELRNSKHSVLDTNM